eukprot:CAMPEP_0118671718 /NCGR_PEP_ID=MMETSP0785-20121206/22153_1 /TAXON_ID=91992 /ORGANISM="Bolidomonas pacifica, Strain CCMP 1866" /LENGTH=55 /DNA_ID=CAMNT_0006566625 /DNA_START=122 /DNA_END=286 /DNA_ORIENTATION=-
MTCSMVRDASFPCCWSFFAGLGGIGGEVRGLGFESALMLVFASSKLSNFRASTSL